MRRSILHPVPVPHTMGCYFMHFWMGLERLRLKGIPSIRTSNYRGRLQISSTRTLVFHCQNPTDFIGFIKRRYTYPQRYEWGGTAKEFSLCAKGACGTQRKEEWLPASANNARDRRGQSVIQLTSTEENDHLSAMTSLPMEITKRQQTKARVYAPKSQAMELQTQT